jgi:hypothetical protein
MRTAKYSKPICISLKPETYNEIKQISDRRRESMAETLRDIITKYFKREAEEEKQLLMNQSEAGADNFSESLEELVREPQKGDVSR